jgi:hypothetical protein
MTAVAAGAAAGLVLAMSVDRVAGLLTRLKTRDPVILAAVE